MNDDQAKTESPDTAEATATQPEPPSHATQVVDETRPVSSLVLPLDTPPIEVETETDEAGLRALLEHTEATWTLLGEEEPHWSVISAERFKQSQLEENRQEFYASGAQDLALFLAFLQRNGVDPDRIERLLEYGCGLGRVTRFFAERFPQVLACDISPSHLRQAELHLQACGLSNVELLRIRGIDDIKGPADLDAVFSVIVLQHNPPPTMVAILDRLLARLRPGGIAYFQVPTHAVDYRFQVADYLAHGLHARHVEMHYLPQRHVFRLAREHGCDVLEVREDDWVGRRQVELSNTFLLQKR